MARTYSDEEKAAVVARYHELKAGADWLTFGDIAARLERFEGLGASRSSLKRWVAEAALTTPREPERTATVAPSHGARLAPASVQIRDTRIDPLTDPLERYAAELGEDGRAAIEGVVETRLFWARENRIQEHTIRDGLRTYGAEFDRLMAERTQDTDMRLWVADNVEVLARSVAFRRLVNERGLTLSGPEIELDMDGTRPDHPPARDNGEVAQPRAVEPDNNDRGIDPF